MKVAAAYIRVSTDMQVEYSPDSQLRLIREYAKSHGFIIPDEFIYTELGVSGKKADKNRRFLPADEIIGFHVQLSAVRITA